MELETHRGPGNDGGGRDTSVIGHAGFVSGPGVFRQLVFME